jgi:4-amino-4-deoxy-L-arabinose transferase-like glycosyltransferase
MVPRKEEAEIGDFRKMGTPGSEIASAALLPQKMRLLILILLAVLLILPGLNRTGLAGYDDAFHAHEGREMASSGDWGNIRFNGKITFDYLPMFCWMEATSFKVLGINDFAGKFPAALLGLGTIVLLYFLTLELTGQAWLALLAMMVLMSTQFFLKLAGHAMTDVPFAFFFTLAIFLYLKGLKKPPYLALLGVPIGLGLLTRSLIGLLPLGVIVLHLLLSKRHKLLFSPWLALGVLLALSFPSAWLAVQVRQHGVTALTSHFGFVQGKLHAGEATSQWRSLLNYPTALLKYYWPWLPFLLAGFVHAARVTISRRDTVSALLIVWVLVVLVSFSFAQTRYPRYILSAFPAFSILSAMALNRWLPEGRRDWFFKDACLAGCLAVFLTIVFPAKQRATDILALAPVADANSLPEERIFFYTYEDKRNDFEWQYLWYGHRYTELSPTLNAMATRLTQEKRATGIVDNVSYQQLLGQLPPETSQQMRILARSENLVCFQLY